MRSDVEVLVVEDDPDDAELTLCALRALRAHGADKRVVHVADGDRAVDFIFSRNEFARRAHEGPPKVVLLDLKLHGLDGLEVLRRIKGDARTRMIPVVIFAAALDDRITRTSYELGANSCVSKPASLTAYLDRVAAIGRYWLSLSRPAHLPVYPGLVPV